MTDVVAITAAAGAKPTLLVVDDELLVRLMTAGVLRDDGYTVIEAVSADEALAVLRSPLRVDLVLTDLHMPGELNGAALVRVVRSELPAVKVVMVSADRPDDAILAMLDDYLQKPFTPSALTRCVRALMPPAMKNGA